jgi:hypothetical protein
MPYWIIELGKTNRMKKIPVVIAFSTLYLFFFQLAPFIGINEKVIVGMFMLSPVVVLYMVYVILKYGKPSSFTFDERFYDDWDYIRNGKEALNAE